MSKKITYIVPIDIDMYNPASGNVHHRNDLLRHALLVHSRVDQDVSVELHRTAFQ